MDWHGLAWIGKDWQIGEFVSKRKIGPGLAPDWHELARIGTDCLRIRSGLAQDWLRIGAGLALKWLSICSGFAQNWHPTGL